MFKVILPLLLLSATALAQPTAGTPKGVPAPAPSAPAAPTVKITEPVVATVPSEPTTPEEAINAGKQVIDYAKAKNWFGLSAICILILMYVLKAFGLFKKIGKRWAYIILPVLGVLSMLFANLVGGISWNSAWLVLSSAPVAALLNDFFKRGVLGKEYETPMNPAGSTPTVTPPV